MLQKEDNMSSSLKNKRNDFYIDTLFSEIEIYYTNKDEINDYLIPYNSKINASLNKADHVYEIKIDNLIDQFAIDYREKANDDLIIKTFGYNVRSLDLRVSIEWLKKFNEDQLLIKTDDNNLYLIGKNWVFVLPIANKRQHAYYRERRDN